MNILTSSFELGTAITNVFIFVVSIIIYLKNDFANKYWKSFFLCLVIDSLLGVIIHGIIMNDMTKLILWIILSLIFCITINILLTIFLMDYNNKVTKKTCVILTILIYFIIILEYIFKIDFLNTFIIYACICLLLILIICINKLLKTKDKKYSYYILGIISQIIGGIFLINKSFHINCLLLDKNGIYHLFMVITAILFYKGMLKK